MKLEFFKFQDGKVFTLPEYPEKRPMFRNFSAEANDKLHYEDELNVYDEAVANSLASAIEVAPEYIEDIRFRLWDHHFQNTKFRGPAWINYPEWQPENGKVYSAECEMEIRQKCQHKGIHNSTCIYRQVARLKPSTE